MIAASSMSLGLISAALVSGCGGPDSSPGLSLYFRATRYADPACNIVDQRLAGGRQMRLYNNGNVALAATTQGLASYYARHGLSFSTDAPPQTTTMAYALNTDHVSLSQALAAAFPDVDVGNDAALLADPALYTQVLGFTANFVFQPIVEFANTHSDGGAGVTNLVLVPNVERSAADTLGEPTNSLAGLTISPALLAEFARTMPDQARVWQGIDLSADFAPTIVLGDDVLQMARAVDPVLDDLFAAHEFGHSAALVHSTVPTNLMYPNLEAGQDDCTDMLDDAQLTTMSHALAASRAATEGALLSAETSAGPPRPSSGDDPSFAPDRLRALLSGDRQAMRSFVNDLYLGAAGQ